MPVSVPPSPEHAHGRPSNMTFVVLAAGTGFYALLQSLVSPVLTEIQHHMHTSVGTVGTWVMTAYLLSASVFTPLLGRVGDLLASSSRREQRPREPDQSAAVLPLSRQPTRPLSRHTTERSRRRLDRPAWPGPLSAAHPRRRLMAGRAPLWEAHSTTCQIWARAAGSMPVVGSSPVSASPRWRGTSGPRSTESSSAPAWQTDMTYTDRPPRSPCCTPSCCLPTAATTGTKSGGA
jgi:hypothetical protein